MIADTFATAVAATPQQFVKKPVQVNAIQWPSEREDQRSVLKWIKDNGGITGFQRAPKYVPMQPGSKQTMIEGYEYVPFIKTLEGDMFIGQGDYIIQGVKGEFYPCKADIFLMSYEGV